MKNAGKTLLAAVAIAATLGALWYANRVGPLAQKGRFGKIYRTRQKPVDCLLMSRVGMSPQ
jgi:hypothetical protein